MPAPERPPQRSRDSLFSAAAATPRLTVKADVFYESDEANVFAERVDVSLRGLFVPCRFPTAGGRAGDPAPRPRRRPPGEGRDRGPARVRGRQDGLALQIVSMPDPTRLRFAAYLLRRAG
jgi:hypothetical protein